jgi:hypothetical protein
VGEHKTRRETRGIAILLASLSALGPFSIDTYLPSFHEIGERLNATPIEVQQTLSIYLLSFALMTPGMAQLPTASAGAMSFLSLLACSPSLPPAALSPHALSTCGSGVPCRA